MRGPSEWLEAAAEVVERLTDRWVAAGALAAMSYRRARRLTTDADLLVTWHEDLIPTLEREGFGPLKIHSAPPDHPHLLMARNEVVGHVDFIIPTEEYQELAVTRGMERHILTVEDVIVHKLLAWRPKDRDDVASILAAGHALDVDYIEDWASRWDVLENWETANRPPREQRPD